MPQQQKTRREVLEEFVAANPSDAFARYGLAVECAKGGDADTALEHFRQLLAANPDYVAGYFQYGQFLAQLRRNDEARQILTTGIAVARRVGNQHAASEMEAAREELR